MAFVITDNCTACGLCIPECPIEAIHVGDPIYVIDETCCDFEECVAACPDEAIIPEDELTSAPESTSESTSETPSEARA